MGKQRGRQQPSKNKVQVKHKRAGASSGAGEDGAIKPVQAGADASGTSAQLAGPRADMPVYGLNNLGNTCFYNSALQVLVAVPTLRDFCTLPQPGEQLKKGPIGRALEELVQTVNGQRDVATQDAKSAKLSRKGGAPVFSPSRLLAAVCKIAPIFKGGQQQDSHELMRCLVEGLHAEEQRALEQLRKKGDDKREAEGGEAGAAPAPLRGKSFMEGVFGGRLASHVACGECGRESVTLETFYDLSLPIPAGLPQPASLEDARRKRAKVKQEPGQGEASPAEPAAAQPAALSTKQRKKAEREARKKAQQLDRRRQQKQGGADAGAAGGAPGDSGAGGEISDGGPAVSVPAAAEEPKLRGGSGSDAATGTALASLAEEDSSGTSSQATATAVPQAQYQVGGVCAPDLAQPDPAPLARASSTASSTQTLSAQSLARADLLDDASSGESQPDLAPPAARGRGAGFAASGLTGSYVSRNANTLTPDQTAMQAAGGGAGTPTAKSGTLGSCPAAARAGQVNAPLQACVRAEVARQRAEERAAEVRRLSERLRSASLAPDAKSGNCPGQGSSLVERSARGARDEEANTDSSTEGEVAPDQVIRPRGGSAALDPPPAGLAGGFADTGSSSAVSSSLAFTTTSSSLVSSSVGSAVVAVPAAGQRATPGGAGLPALGPQLAGPPVPDLAGHDAAAAHILHRLQTSISAPAEQRQQIGLPGTGAGVGRHEDVARADDGKGEDALYADLDALQAKEREEEASVLGDASETGEVDAESLQERRLHLGDAGGVPSPAQAAQAEEPCAPPADPPATETPEETAGEAGVEEMGALGSLFEEGNAADLTTCEEEPQPLDADEEWEAMAAPEQAAQEATLEGCLAAFFARETVTWECPYEAADRERAAAKAARSGAGDGAQGLAASSLAASSQGTPPQLLKRRSVSFSEEAPRVKLVPGSAEQRGTNFARALAGRTPFCRPLKAGRAYFLLTAEVDELSHDKLHLGLQAQDETEETVSALAEVHAINNAISFGFVPIAPIDDAEDEEEQARVKGQAQALLDCAADLVAEGGLQSAVDLLQDGTELRRCSSTSAGSDTWRVVGTIPATQPGSPGGTWEHPPQGYASPQDSDPSDLVSTGSLWGMSSLGSDAPSLGARSRSPSLLSRFSSFASSAAGGQGTTIPEAPNEGASSSSGGEEASSSASASEAPGGGSLPLNGVGGAESASHAGGGGAGGEPEGEAGGASSPPAPPGLGFPDKGVLAESDILMVDRQHGKDASGLPLVSGAANGHHAAGGMPNGLPNGAHASADAAGRSLSGSKGEGGTANGHHGAAAHSDEATHAPDGGARAEPKQAASPCALRIGAPDLSSSQRSEQTGEEGAPSSHSSSAASAESGSSREGGSSRHAPSDALRAALRAGLLVRPDTTAVNGHGAHQQRSIGEGGTEPTAPLVGEAAGAADGDPAGTHAGAAGATGPGSGSLPGEPSSPAAGAAAAGEALGAAKGEGGCGSGGGGAAGLGRSRPAGGAERGILRKSAVLPLQREAGKRYLIHRAPEVLTCHLKRFQQDARGRLRKIQGGIPFARELDLAQYCDPKGLDAGGARYALVGVVEHRGSLMASGHYTSFSARHPAWSLPSPCPPDASPSKGPCPTSSTASTQDARGSAAAASSQEAAHAAAGEAGGCTGPGKYAAAARAAARGLGDPAALQWFRQSDAHVTRVPWETVAAAEAYILVFVRIQ